MENVNYIQYYMPTKILYGHNVILKNGQLFKQLGNKALIVTGKSSAKKNGSLNHMIELLEQERISYVLFDQVEENPSIETVVQAGKVGIDEKVDMVIGIGGGSPIDAAKAIGVIIKNPQCDKESLFLENSLKSIPIIAIPTTAGTGTETTPYAILTDHEQQTKRNFSPKIFPEVALLDPQYFKTMPYQVMINTAVDALSHLIEGFLTVKANFLSDLLAQQGLSLWGQCLPHLKTGNLSQVSWQHLIMASTIGGMVIAQSGTSLPHGMGYNLTYYKDIPHGKANGVLIVPYLKLHPHKEKVQTILSLLKMQDLDNLHHFLISILGDKVVLTEKEIEIFSESMTSNQAKLANHPQAITKEEIRDMYATLS